MRRPESGGFNPADAHGASAFSRAGARSSNAKARGFTLLEVLVALLLLALAMVALVRSAGQEAQALVQQREATLAQWIAANVIAETRLSRDLPDNGQRQGEQRYAGRDWRWQLDVAATDDPGVLRLEVRVHPRDGDVAMPAATLIGFFAP